MSESRSEIPRQGVFAIYMSGAPPLIYDTFRRIEASPRARGRSDVCVRNLLFTLAICTKPERILEIGCHIGAATLVMAYACHVNHVGVVFGLEPNPAFHDQLCMHLQQSGLAAYTRIELAQSTDASTVQALAAQGKFQLVFIDACHNYRSVEQELNIYGPMVSDNGFIILHDSSLRSVLLDKEGMGGVRRAILDFCQMHDNYNPTFFEYPIWGNPTGTCMICKQMIAR